ncbi:MAG: TauD/TfdA family dioxygenase, partial [bacterium]|nr:TauD/TfdA family dioxygenase [bacterium]
MSIKVTALPAALGATVEGLDADHLDDGVAAELREAFWAHKVLFFPQIHLTDEQHVALGSLFGDLEAVSNDDTDHRDHHTVDDEGKILVLDSSNEYSRANFWHTDVTFARQPPLGSLLSMKESPPSGGDTMWANTQAAYEGLSDPIKAALEGVVARHGRAGLTEFTDHPAITTHPETGKRILFVNRGWTSSLQGMSHLESRCL